MWYKLNIQNFAGPIPYDITVNDENFTIVRTRDDINTTWEIDASANTSLYSINNNLVIWNNGTILQYNGVDVLPTDYIHTAAYTTRANEPTTGTINKLRLGSKTPIKYYLGSKELFKMYLGNKIVYQKQLIPQLTAPQNLSVENTTLSFDEVENAEEYEVFVDNVSIGSYQIPKIKVYGVTGLGESSPTLTRTDDNIGLTQDSQELHDFFVANEDVTDSNGNHFVQLKKFFVKILGTDYVTGYQVSHTKIDDSYILCPMFYDKDGNEIDYAYYGKYKGYVTNNKLYSQAGKTPTYSTTIDNFMTYARNNGSNEYYAIDWATIFTAQIMFMIVYANTKYDTFFTFRKYGSTTGSGGTTSTFLGIEDMVGNGFEFLVNVAKQSGSSRFYYKNYIGDWTSGIIASGNYFDGAPASSGYTSKHLYNVDKPITTMFPSELAGSSTTFYCDYYEYNNASATIIFGAIGNYDNEGLTFLKCLNPWSFTNSNLGSRLCAKKLI